ncbi:UbiA prenyltransferase family-domain-containing protein [Mycena rebaudengoi]|nr:UbiA prenyltransferase family-domain-containing protein [Mycena rebaudengoi]KAJ7294105.1 UbiA prenyltransferase family-domain-containing protein [Mycena rebaudengoi]
MAPIQWRFAEISLPPTYSLGSMPLLASVTHVIRTAFYFTKSDFKTIVFPVILYGIAASCQIRPDRIPQLTVWVWLHLLQICTANQMCNAEEDRLNKPYRPIPSGLISAHDTKVLRWILAPICLALSWKLNVFYAGLSLAVSFILYNELGLGSYWHSKNIMNAIGIVSWNVGAAKMMREGIIDSEGPQWLAPYISTIVISTTIQIQDFRDEAGDRMQGHMTLAILMPEFCRRITSLLIMCWSLGLVRFWGEGLNPRLVTSILVLGTFISLRVMLLRSQYQDKVTLRWYMLWLTIAQLLPFWTSCGSDQSNLLPS